MQSIGADTGIILNTTLTGDPVLEGDYMSVPFDGTFIIENRETPEIDALRAANTAELPIHRPDGKQV